MTKWTKWMGERKSARSQAAYDAGEYDEEIARWVGEKMQEEERFARWMKATMALERTVLAAVEQYKQIMPGATDEQIVKRLTAQILEALEATASA